MNLDSHFTDEETEAQRVVVACQGHIASKRQKGTERGLSPYNGCLLSSTLDDRRRV